MFRLTGVQAPGCTGHKQQQELQMVGPPRIKMSVKLQGQRGDHESFSTVNGLGIALNALDRWETCWRMGGLAGLGAQVHNLGRRGPGVRCVIVQILLHRRAPTSK